jgi:hypothetical protein
MFMTLAPGWNKQASFLVFIEEEECVDFFCDICKTFFFQKLSSGITLKNFSLRRLNKLLRLSLSDTSP